MTELEETVKATAPCDYCGGYEYTFKSEHPLIRQINEPRAADHLHEDCLDRPWLDVKICVRCLKKLVDTILGEPKRNREG